MGSLRPPVASKGLTPCAPCGSAHGRTARRGAILLAVAGIGVAVLAMVFDRFLGLAGGAMLTGAIALQFDALALLARERRRTAEAVAVARVEVRRGRRS